MLFKLLIGDETHFASNYTFDFEAIAVLAMFFANRLLALTTPFMCGPRLFVNICMSWIIW